MALDTDSNHRREMQGTRKTRGQLKRSESDGRRPGTRSRETGTVAGRGGGVSKVQVRFGSPMMDWKRKAFVARVPGVWPSNIYFQ